MNNLNLTSGENFFLNVYRYFEFIRLKGYKGENFSLSDRGSKYLTFYNHLKSQKISIIETEDGFLDFVIEKKSFFKKPISFYELTDIKYTGVKYFSQVIKSNKIIMDSI